MVEEAQSAARSSSTDQRRKEEAVRRLRASGDYERLRQQLLAELLTDEQWLDSIQEALRRSEGNVVDLTYEELVAKVVPLGKSSVPAERKTKMLERIRTALEKEHI